MKVEGGQILSSHLGSRMMLTRSMMEAPYPMKVEGGRNLSLHLGSRRCFTVALSSTVKCLFSVLLTVLFPGTYIHG